MEFCDKIADWLRRIAAVGALPAAVFLLAGAPASAGPAEESGWPDGKRPQLSAEEYDERVDGIRSRWLELTGAGLELKWFPSSEWRIPEKRMSDRASFEFVFRTVPEMRMQLFHYAKDDWLTDIGKAELRRYVASLEAQFPDAEIDVANSGAFEPPLGSAPFLSGHYRWVFYTVAPEDGSDGGKPFGVADALTLTEDGGLLVVRVRGPENAVNRLRQRFDLELAQFVEM